MSLARFERTIIEAVADLGRAALETPLGDSHTVAKLKGEAIGLRRALDLYKIALRADDDEDNL